MLESKNKSVFGQLETSQLAALSLLFRQTNIFWVAIFPAGLKLVSLLKARKGARSELKEGAGDFVTVVRDSWEHGQVYDPYVQDAYLEGRINGCNLADFH